MVNKKYAKYNFLILCLLSGLCIISLYFFVYIPQIHKIAQLENNYTQKKQSVEAIQNFITLHTDIAKYEKEVRKKGDFVNQLFSNDTDAFEVIQTIEHVAQRHQLILNNIKLLPLIKHEEYNEISFVVEFKGNYFDILKFLREVETIKPLCNIKSLIVNEKGGVLFTKLELSIYHIQNK